MESHLELNDDMFELQFQTCTLSPALFTHEAHLRLAWLHINKYGMEKAIEHICKQLLIYVDFAGATDKYNQTLTVAAIHLVNQCIKKSNRQEFTEFIKLHQVLITNFKELIARHYSMNIINSSYAKKEYLEPDLLPFR